RHEAALFLAWRYTAGVEGNLDRCPRVQTLEANRFATDAVVGREFEQVVAGKTAADTLEPGRTGRTRQQGEHLGDDAGHAFVDRCGHAYGNTTALGHGIGIQRIDGRTTRQKGTGNGGAGMA